MMMRNRANQGTGLLGQAPGQVHGNVGMNMKRGIGGGL